MFHAPFSAFLSWQRVATDATRMMITAGSVMQIRLMQMSLGVMRPEEATRMVMEKPVAFARGAQAAAASFARSQDLALATSAGMRPIGRATSANARRLSRSKS